MINLGLQNEQNIIAEINEKKFSELNEFWKETLTEVFGKTADDEIVLCQKGHVHEKADIYIHMNHLTRSFSIKSGDNVSVHSEKLSTFCGFLKWLGIDDQTIMDLKLYHYGDGTLTGTGKFRRTSSQLLIRYPSRIKKMNEVFKDEDILRKILFRVLSTGTIRFMGFTYYIYYGDNKSGIYADIKGLVEFLIHKNYDNNKYVHFGPLVYNAAYRGIKDFDPTNVRRYYTNIKWPTIIEDITEYMESKKKKV